MKIVSVQPSIVWYVVTDLPYSKYGKRLRAVQDVRLYEVSPSSKPGSESNTGLLVAGKTQAEAEANVRDILQSYSIIVP